MKISFLSVSFRRLEHTAFQQQWISKHFSKQTHDTYEHIIVCNKTEHELLLPNLNNAHSHLIPADITSPLNKARWLNLAACYAKGEWFIPLDVDLLPNFDWSLLSRNSTALQHLVFSGYRIKLSAQATDALMSNDLNTFSKYWAIAQHFQVAIEDQPRALQKQLLERERFGVCPIYMAKHFRWCGGYDEKFVGWGGEDQDLTERISKRQGLLVRNPDYLWLHLDHPTDQVGWNDEVLTDRNRKRYYKNRP